MKKVLTLALAAVLCLSLVAGCQPAQSDNELVMATNAEFPPFEYVNDDGEYDGFDVRMAQAIAEEMGMTLRIDNMNFDSVLTAVSSGKADVGIAAMTVRADRLENADFSDSYFQTTQVIIVPLDSPITGPADLAGKRIAVQEGTTGDLYCDEEIPDCVLSRFKKAPDTILELKNGRVDAIVVDKDVANLFIQDNPDLLILPDDLTQEEYAIAVRKGNSELLSKLNDAIKSLRDSGKYDEIFNEFFS